MTCRIINGPQVRAIVCGQGTVKASNGDLEVLRAFAADMRACREAGHKMGQAADCPRCRRELAYLPKEPTT